MPVYGTPEGALNQGDVIDDVPFFMRQGNQGHTLVPTPGLIFSHSCDLDKYDEVKGKLNNNERKRFPALVLPLYSPAMLNKDDLGHARSGKHRRYFLVPKEGGQPDFVADFWLLQPVPLLVLRGLQRVGTLSDEYLAKLWTHAFVTVSRKDPTEVFKGGRLAP